MKKLEEYQLYRHKEDGRIFMLTQDINGLWYLTHRHHSIITDSPHLSKDEIIELIKKDFAPELTQEEKAKRYDELAGWYLWLKRRTHDGRTPKSQVETFLKGFGEVFKKGE
ncbi:hypothetical protein [Bacillus phage vB_BanS-Thrax5]|nr:hypothetical protein [Bacillus phage vB_BanS-Thrax5]